MAVQALAPCEDASLPPLDDDDLIDLLPAAVYICEAPSGLIARYNRRAAELWGREPEPGARFCGSYRLYHPDGRHLHHDASPVAEAIHTGTPQGNREAIIERPDGSRVAVLVNVVPVRDDGGGVLWAVSVLQDISERRRTEEALRASRARLAGIIESAMDAIITVDGTQRITVFNRAAEEMFRCPAAKAMGQPLDRFVPERFRAAHRRHVQAFGATGVTSRSMSRPGRLTALRADGEEFPIEATISQVEAGGQRLFTVILRDVTERHRADEERERLLAGERAARAEAEAAAQACEAFLARASHELRTPMTSALGTIRWLRRAIAGDIGESPEALLDIADRNLRSMVALVDDLLDASKLASGADVLLVEPVPLREVVETSVTAVAAQARERGVRVAVHVPPGLSVLGDARRLEQLLVNLVGNGVKFTPRDGEVTVDATALPDTIVIRVRDTGRGIAPEHVERIFEPFFRAETASPGTRRSPRTRGTGLGLAICRQIVTLHGGRIRAESEGPGRGSTFVVEIPAAGAGMQPCRAEPA